MSSPPSTTATLVKVVSLQVGLMTNTDLLLFYIFRTKCSADQAVPASTGQVFQQPPCFLEDEEEELYISESMQEITDGDVAQTLYECSRNSKHTH